MEKLKSYYVLTKPGIVRGNTVTASAGFFLASGEDLQLDLLALTLLGLSLVVASAAAFNNYIDRTIDSKMKRTQNRALVSGQISSRNALVFAAAVGVIGILLLAVFTTSLAAVSAISGFILYVFAYSLRFKRRTVYGTEVGSLSGAVPPVVGYTAVSGQIDTAAIILFMILIFWQMPHFYAIAMYRIKDYAAAKIPVLPIQKGIGAAKKYILVYIILFTAAVISLTVTGYTGKIYALIAVGLGLAWLILGLQTYNRSDSQKWGRDMFLFSLLVISALCATIAVDSLANLK